MNTFCNQIETSVNAITRNVIAQAQRNERGQNLIRDGYSIQGAWAKTDDSTYFVFHPVSGVYIVRFDITSGLVSCTCKDFEITRMPCKHCYSVLANKASVDEATASMRLLLAQLSRKNQAVANTVMVSAHVRTMKSGRVVQVTAYTRRLPLCRRITDAGIKAQYNARYGNYAV